MTPGEFIKKNIKADLIKIGYAETDAESLPMAGGEVLARKRPLQ